VGTALAFSTSRTGGKKRGIGGKDRKGGGRKKRRLTSVIQGEKGKEVGNQVKRRGVVPLICREVAKMERKAPRKKRSGNVITPAEKRGGKKGGEAFADKEEKKGKGGATFRAAPKRGKEKGSSQKKKRRNGEEGEGSPASSGLHRKME